jgi:tRNA pseudouridine55 synthase
MMFGLLNLHKPAGWTSRDAVNRVQRLVRPHKVGHAGTLDPLATGVLVIGIGPATRLVEYVQRMPKRYRATFLLGRESDTEDVAGTVRELTDPPVPTRDAVAAALPQFLGRIAQRPPAYSALKVAGKRAYALARAGKNVELAEREIDVYAMTIVDYDYPRLVLDVECGSGTYVRSLGRDLAAALGTCAVMEALTRSAIGEFRLADAIHPETLTLEQIRASLLPAHLAVAQLPQVTLSAEEVVRIGRGQSIERSGADLSTAEFAAVDANGNLLAILGHRGEGKLGPTCSFVAANSQT